MIPIARTLRCVVFVGKIADPNSLVPKFIPYGTGFLFSVFYDDIRFDYIVTCHHVIEEIGGDKIWVRINLKDGQARSIAVPKTSWVFDAKLDIAVLSQEIGDIFDVTRIVEKDIMTKEVFEEYDRDYISLEGEATWLVGLFTSHYGTAHNMPIVRVGNIAAIPEELIYTDTGYVKAFLVETRSIGGLSGSPVFIPRNSWQNELKDDQIECKCLGMMRGRLNTQDANDVVAGDSIADQCCPVNRLKKVRKLPKSVRMG